MDHLSTLLSRCAFHAQVFYNGLFCGSNGFKEDEQVGQLHIVRDGSILMHHDDRASLHIDVPTLVFYPRGLNHQLVVPPGASTNLLCARIEFAGGRQNALAKALPDCLQVALHEAPSLAQTIG